ncbi:MAG: hypothetical protein GX592_13800, partial [Clostridiales bacterium]|nr:hypothetical protein [Clostridiales bacterium]
MILGAGKIGRGFAADVFSSGGYRVLFADANKQLVDALKSQGYYTLRNVRADDEQEKKVMRDFEVMHAGDRALPSEIAGAGLVAVSVFPDAFPATAKVIAEALVYKHTANDHTPLDAIVLANISRPQAALLAQIRGELPESLHGFMDEVLGVCGTVVIRVAVTPSAEMLSEDPLTVLTDGHNVLPVERRFKGECPRCPMLEYHDSLDTLEALKLYTYNMAHAAAAYLGFTKGATSIAEALGDPAIEQVVRGALEEVLDAFVCEGEFSEDARQPYIDGVVKKFKNPLLGDTPARVGGNPKRKLGYDDRIIGAARMARKNGIYPYYLAKVAAYGFLFAESEDAAAMEIRNYTMQEGIDAAIRTYTGLWEPDLVYAVKRHYLRADGRLVPEDAARAAFLKRAYALGFHSERKHRGCAQGALIALRELTGIGSKDLFRAATGFSGGMALCGDGACGGYSGGILFMGLINGRDYDRMLVDGDKQNQYIAYEAAQRLHDHYQACFASPVC